MEISVFLTYKEVLNYLHNQGEDAVTNENYDANIQTFTKAAHDKICKYLGYEIISTSYTEELYSGTGSTRLYPKNRPIAQVDLLMEDSSIIPPDNYIVFENYILMREGFKPGIANYSVSYTAGWIKSKMPYDLKLAGLQLVELYINTMGRIGRGSISTGQSSESVDFEAEMRILKSIDSYRGFNKL